MSLKLKALAKYLPIMVFIAVSVLVGEEHPFTRFPMYAKFPGAIDYYYFADENRQPVSGLKEFSFTVSQLKDQMGAYLNQHDREPQNEVVGASLILKKVSEANPPYFQTHNSLSVMRKNLRLEQGRIVEADTLLATIKREHDSQ